MPPDALALRCVAAGVAAAILWGDFRWRRPGAPAIDLARLADVARGLRADLDGRPHALSLVLHTDVRGVAQDARLRIVLPAVPKGLLRLDIARAYRAERASWTGSEVLLVVSRAGSSADRALAEALPDAEILDAGPRRVARQIALGDPAATLAPILHALAACPVDPPAALPAAEPVQAAG